LPEISEIPGYRLIEKIGIGSTATVWRAKQESLNRDVAIKILNRDLWSQISEADAFIAEARTVALLKNRHVIQVYDVAQLADTAYIVMEFVDGAPLTRRLRQFGPVRAKEAIHIAIAVADALEDAWITQGIIHRDIKPDNIIIEQDGSIKIADLGLARQIRTGDRYQGDGEIAGTPNYMSPEQAAGKYHLGVATDMYSLGATLYHILTGVIPFADMHVEDILEAQISEQLPWPQDLNPEIPLPLCQLITRLMMKEPGDRYPDWGRVFADASKMAEGRMVVIKLDAAAISTVARSGEMNSNHRKAIRLKKHRGPGTMAASLANRRKGPPLWLSKTLEYARSALILALFWSLLIRPYLRSKTNPATSDHPVSPAAAPAPQRTPGQQHPLADIPPPVALPVPQASADGPDRNVDIDSHTTQDDPDTDMDNGPPIESFYGYQDGSESGQMDFYVDDDGTLDFKDEILANIIQGQFAEAQASWSVEEHGEVLALPWQDREKLEALLRPENNPMAVLARSLARMAGKVMDFRINNTVVSLLIERVAGESLEAMIRSQTGTATIMRPYNLLISHLIPEEQMRILRMSDDPAAPYALAIFALKGANYELALEMAPHAGPLEETIQKFAEARITRLLTP
jgi:eukaryotic-like serine/threonine-protein kinase